MGKWFAVMIACAVALLLTGCADKESHPSSADTILREQPSDFSKAQETSPAEVAAIDREEENDADKIDVLQGFYSGGNFGNLHIRTNDADKVVAALEKLFRNAPLDYGDFSASQADELDIIDQYVYKMELKSNPQATKGMEVSVVSHTAQLNDRWVSVLHKQFQWGGVREAGKELSLYLTEPVMAVGYFDGDVLELSIYEQGQLQAERLWSSEASREVYGLREKIIDRDYMAEQLELNEERMDRLLAHNDPDLAVEQLANGLRMPIGLSAEALEDDDFAEMREMYVTHEFTGFLKMTK